MKELNIPFSLFDFFAVLMPGALGLLALYIFINPSLTPSGHEAIFSRLALPRFSGDLTLLTTLVLSAYMLGQVFNALSEILIDRPFNRLRGAHIVRDIKHHNVRAAIEKHFGEDILKQSIRRTFIMVESAVAAKFPEAAATARRFIALAVMSQSLALGLLFIGAALIRAQFYRGPVSESLAELLAILVGILVLIALMLWSYRRFKRMWSQTICMSFVASVTGRAA
jgi:hypothetical protein